MFTLCPLLVVAWSLAFPSPGPATQPEAQRLDFVAVAADRTLRIEVPRGSAAVTGTDQDRVTAVASPAGHGQCAAAAASIRRDEAHLVLALAARQGCEFRWQVTVPARVALEVWADDGAVEVSGMRAGVHVSGRAGNVRVAVSGGPARVDRQVGDVAITTRSPCVRSAEARSRVGRVALKVEGHPIEFPDAPGPGSSVALRGLGTDIVAARVGVGSATVNLAGGSACGG